MDLDFAPLSQETGDLGHQSDFVGRVKQSWKVLLVCALLGVAASCVRTYLAKPVYEAKATVFFPTRQPSILGQTGATESAGTAASVFGVGATPIRVYRGFLESETALDHVSSAAGEKREDIKKMRTLEEEASTSTINIGAKSRDPQKALQVVRLFVRELAEINQRMGLNGTSDDVKVIEGQLASAKKRLTDAEAKSTKLQEQAVSAPSISSSQSGVLALPGNWSQQLAVLKAQRTTEDRKIQAAIARVNVLASKGIQLPSELPPIKKFRPILSKLQLDLRTKEISLGPDAPEIRSLRAEIQINQTALQKELTDYVRGVDVGLLDPTVAEGDLPGLLASRLGTESQIRSYEKLAAQAPSESTSISRALREVTVQGTIVQQLTVQLEMAKIQAARDPNRWSLLDEPRLSDEPINKSMLRAGLFGLIGGLFVGAVIALCRRSNRAH